MTKWLRVKEALIDLNRYTMYRARRTSWSSGMKNVPKDKTWYVEGRNEAGDDVHFSYASSEAEAQELLDKIYEALSTE